jgi:hypothetical protein
MYDRNKDARRKLQQLIEALEQEREVSRTLANRELEILTSWSGAKGMDYAGHRETYGTARARAELCNRVASQLANVLATRPLVGKRPAARRSP